MTITLDIICIVKREEKKDNSEQMKPNDVRFRRDYWIISRVQVTTTY